MLKSPASIIIAAAKATGNYASMLTIRAKMIDCWGRPLLREILGQTDRVGAK